MEEPAAGGLPQWTGVYAAFDDVARQVALTVTTSSQAETSARGAGDSPDAGGATDAPAASTATEGNTK